MPIRRLLHLVPAIFQLAALQAQGQDPGSEINRIVSRETGGRLKLSFEIRSRAELRTGQAFGRDPDLAADFIRTRVGVTYTPSPWLKLSVLGQDARAPWYGVNAPGTARDPFDLQEGYAELRPDTSGFGLTAGRQMLNYGDTRLIGSPQWAYTARTYDSARTYYRLPHGRFELLFVSPIKPRGNDFNYPVLGERILGAYNTFASLPLKTGIDLYALRHHQNRPGGFAGPGCLRTNTFGGRIFAPLPANFRYTFEGAYQNGRIDPVAHSAWAVAAVIARKLSSFGRPFELALEYKYATGSSNPDTSGTFDQISPAAHDKLGHVDLLGWRNVSNIKQTSTWTVAKPLALTLMYNNSWLASATDAAYNTQGRPIARSAAGNAGTHVGQELDLFGAYKKAGLALGAGYGHFFAGEFIHRTTAGISPHYFYVFQSYAF